MESLLAKARPSPRMALDLLAGAIDARLNPQWTPEGTATEEEEIMLAHARCSSTSISKAEAMRGAAWMLGTCFVLTALAIALDQTFGQHVAIDALLYSAFFIALTISSRHTYFRPYSKAAQTVMAVGGSVAWYAFFLGMTALATLI
jgi:hypothetical protein